MKEQDHEPILCNFKEDSIESEFTVAEFIEKLKLNHLGPYLMSQFVGDTHDLEDKYVVILHC